MAAHVHNVCVRQTFMTYELGVWRHLIFIRLCLKIADHRSEEKAQSKGPNLMPTSPVDAPPFFETANENDGNFAEAEKDDFKCIICRDNSKNATFIHRDTGHFCCCWTCAMVLKQRGDPCPICRAPIEKVIKQFNV